MKPWLLRVLKVPPEPTLPPGSRESAQVFRAANNFYHLLVVHWVLAQASAVVGIIVSLTVLHGISANWSDNLRLWVNAAEWVGIASYVAQLPFTFLMIRLDYELRWYIVTDRSLRIRSGLVRMREMTMTFANIQHLSVHQGPLQRLLGLYDLRVRTAGGGGAEGDDHQGGLASVAHIGLFRGVSNAPAIRDLIVERMKQARDAGLGDTDDRGSHEPHPASEPVAAMEAFRAAVAQVRSETALLRQTLGGVRPDTAPDERPPVGV
jgi:membrane protein YdbS with pleckstrin-like domain